MSYFPFFFDLKKFHCLVIGGGEIALNKVRLLSQYQAKITLIAPEIKEEIKHQLNNNQHSTFHQRAFQSEDLDTADIVIVATNDDDFNTQIWHQVKQQNKLVNVVDDKDKCDFIFPAIVNRGELTVAISTSGVAPTIASWLRTKFEMELPQSWRAIMQSLKQQQPAIRKTIPNTRHRRRFYRSLIDSILPYFLSPQQQRTLDDNQVTTIDLIEQSISTHLADCATQQEDGRNAINRAKVYLVGAGPGDPELLTLRAQQVLQQADVVLYDRLLNDNLLEYTRRDAEKIFVGKKANNHSKTQQQINQLLIDYARKGNIVARLKGGDPFIFGRGGEEMKEIQQAGVEVEIVPGVSAVNGIAANLGIPLTLRGISDKLLLTSIYATQSHEVNWQQLTQPRQTLALYMGLQNLTKISQQLIQHGLEQETPIALIEKGTFQHQITHYTTLEKVQSQEYIDNTGLKSPVLSIIGEVVNHRRK